MDKNAIKKYAVWARRELISRVSQRAALYEITDKGYGDASADSVRGRVMSAEEKRQRQALIAQIREKGYAERYTEQRRKGKKVYLVGVSFSLKKRSIGSIKLEDL